MLEAAHELLVRSAQCRFRIDVEVARDVGHNEQEITELLLDLGARLGACVADATARIGGKRDLLELPDLFLQLLEHRCEGRPVETDFGGFVLQLDGAGEARQADGNVIEETWYASDG